MIYDFPVATDSIRQGDIFFNIPQIDLSLDELVQLTGDEVDKTSWAAVATTGGKLEIVVPVVSVNAIVITQDCDCLTAPDITLCAIRPFSEVYRSAKDTKSPSSWTKVITQHARLNLRFFADYCG